MSEKLIFSKSQQKAASILSKRESLCCRICGGNKISEFTQIKNINSDEMCVFLVCEDCKSIFDVASSPISYKTSAEYLPPIKFYVEVGAGITAFAEEISLLKHLQINQLSKPKFLEIGAGFGFGVSIAATQGWDAIGIEPDGFGEVGRKMLGIQMISKYLQDTDLPKESFDFIFSSEVIEHVSDPNAFVAIAGKYLKPSGVLLLTTPNSEVIFAGEAVEREWYESLSPGCHINLLSARAIKLILEKNGFKDVKTFFRGGTSGQKQMIVLAAREQNILPDDIDWANSIAEGKTLAIQYLENLVLQKENNQERDIVYRGSLYRLAEIMVNSGSYEAAQTYVEKIDELFKVEGLDEEMLLGITHSYTFDEYVTQVPAYAGLYYFYKGMLSLNYQANYDQARREFHIAAHLCEIEQKIGYFPRVGWPERAKFHEGLALSCSAERQRSDAERIFDTLLESYEKIPYDILASLHNIKAKSSWRKQENQIAIKHLASAFKHYVDFFYKKVSSKIDNLFVKR